MWFSWSWEVSIIFKRAEALEPIVHLDYPVWVVTSPLEASAWTRDLEAGPVQSLLSTEYDKKDEGVFTIRVDECMPSHRSFFAASDFCCSEFTAKKWVFIRFHSFYCFFYLYVSVSGGLQRSMCGFILTFNPQQQLEHWIGAPVSHPCSFTHPITKSVILRTVHYPIRHSDCLKWEVLNLFTKLSKPPEWRNILFFMLPLHHVIEWLYIS